MNYNPTIYVEVKRINNFNIRVMMSNVSNNRLFAHFQLDSVTIGLTRFV